MSGIAGVYNFDGRPVEASTMEAMTRALDHRGPDGSGVWIDGSVGFAHVMLWTTPESLTEKQPLLDASGQLVVTADARIDNRDDLIRSLDLNGREDLSDSELILSAYSKWGECCPEKLVGDFAFAIWDKRKRLLFAARDRIGIKPFYCHHKDGREFMFASEISPIFKAAGLEKRPDRKAIEEYLETADLSHERTLFGGVRRLPPSFTMTIRDGRITTRKYWEPSSGHDTLKLDLDAHAERFRELLTTVVKAQTRSSYPIGCLLSGGLDSSSVLCLASRIVPDKRSLFALSMVFDNLPCDERSFIKEVIQSTSVEWIPHVVDSKALNGWKVLEDCFARQPDWPVQDLPASETLWPLTNAANERGIRVILTGTGGDQVAQGSVLYLADLLSSLRLLTLFRELAYYRFSRSVMRNWMLAPLLPDSIRRTLKRLTQLARQQSDSESLSNGNNDAVWRNPYKLPKRRFKSVASWQQACWIADPLLSLYLDGWWDPLGGHSQIEFRHPFFDVRLIEFLRTLPAEEKFWRGESKIVLRRGMEGVLPPSIRERRTKAEFSPIVGLTLQSMNINPSAMALSRLGFVEGSRVDALVERGAINSSQQSLMSLWRLVRTEAWYKTHFIPEPKEMTHAG